MTEKIRLAADLADLIARLESAEGPSRRLDTKIHRTPALALCVVALRARMAG